MKVIKSTNINRADLGGKVATQPLPSSLSYSSPLKRWINMNNVPLIFVCTSSQMFTFFCRSTKQFLKRSSRSAARSTALNLSSFSKRVAALLYSQCNYHLVIQINMHCIISQILVQKHNNQRKSYHLHLMDDVSSLDSCTNKHKL